MVVGYGTNSAGAPQAVIWTASGGAHLLAGSLGGSYTVARRINDQGLIVGEAGLPGGSGAHTVVWENGVMRDIQSFATGSTFPWGLSNTGIAVGQWNPSGSSYTWTAAGGMLSMAGLEGPNDIPLAVNDDGQIVGWYQGTSTDRPTAFLWTNGVITDLGTLGGAWSTALAINNLAQIVGRTEMGSQRGKRVYHAFLWTAAGGMSDLGFLPGGSSATAVDINDSGMIVGETVWSSGATRATIWKIK